jgi:hypothetical protein
MVLILFAISIKIERLRIQIIPPPLRVRMAAPHHLAARASASGAQAMGSYMCEGSRPYYAAPAPVLVARHALPYLPPLLPTLEQAKQEFLAKYPEYVFENSSIFGGGYKAIQFPKKPTVAGEMPKCTWHSEGRIHDLGAQWQCGCALWTQFLGLCVKEAGLPRSFTYYPCQQCPMFPILAGVIVAYEKLLVEFPGGCTMVDRLQRKMALQRSEQQKQMAENARLEAVAEKARVEAENRANAAAQRALENAQAQQMVAQKLQEEKAEAERLAAQRELAELFSEPPPPLPAAEYRAQDWMTKAQFRTMRQRAGFPLNADQHVCHIIAESNGGANHIDNYYVAAGSLNQSLGNRNDSYLAEAAGLEQTKKAVAVSRTKGYIGLDAEELIAAAKAVRMGWR